MLEEPLFTVKMLLSGATILSFQLFPKVGSPTGSKPLLFWGGKPL